jgi:osmotically inducible protein OsmC
MLVATRWRFRGTSAEPVIEKQGDGFVIPNIDLTTVAEVEGLGDEEFQKIAEETKKTCPVSQVLSGAEISLNATLKKAATA